MSDTSQRLTRDILEWQSRNGLVDELVMLIEAEIQEAVEAAKAKDPFKCEFGHEVYGHKTADGWCCACEADMAFLAAQLHNKETK